MVALQFIFVREIQVHQILTYLCTIQCILSSIYLGLHSDLPRLMMMIGFFVPYSRLHSICQASFLLLL